MEAVNKVQLSYEDLASYTDNFSEESYLGDFQFGKFYRGKIDHFGQTQHVMVKIWEVPEIYICYEGDNQLKLIDEMILLCHEKLITHPGMVKLYGFCVEGDHLGLVYDFKPLDSVCNLIPKDDYFDKIDVFAFGTILLSLISMRVHTEEKWRKGQPFVCDWACEQLEEYVVQPEIDENGVKRPKFTIVHQSLTVEPGFCPDDGHKLSLLGVDCVVRLDYDRPNMKEVLTSLLKLNVVKKHADYLGVNKWLKN